MKKGWKVFNKDLTCRGFQYKIGKTFTYNGEIELCSSGFHFHENSNDLFNYYSFDENNIVCEIVAYNFGKNKVITGDDKSVCAKIKIVKQLSWNDVLNLVNSGDRNSGHRNSGHRNSGYWNSGDGNSGHRNSGDRNSGYWNSGYWNSGDRNSGDGNSGHRNSGYWNSGDRNSGDGNSGDRNSGHWNSGDRNSGDGNSGNGNSGVFCTNKSPKIKIFDIESELTMQEWIKTNTYNILSSNFVLNKWVSEDNMTNEEKKEHPNFYVRGGYLKKYGYKEAWSNLWNNITENERQEIKNIPNFNAEKFEEITGIKV